MQNKHELGGLLLQERYDMDGHADAVSYDKFKREILTTLSCNIFAVECLKS